MRLIDADRLIDNNQDKLSAETVELIRNVPTVYPIFTGRQSGKTILKEYLYLCKVMENHGLSASNPCGNLDFVLNQYQRVICELTHSRLSKLTYYAEGVISCVNEVFSEQERDDNTIMGRWSNKDSDGKPAPYHCTNCGEEAYTSLTNESILSDYCPHCGAEMLKEDH